MTKDIPFPQIISWHIIMTVLFLILYYASVDCEIVILTVVSHVKGSDWHWH